MKKSRPTAGDGLTRLCRLLCGKPPAFRQAAEPKGLSVVERLRLWHATLCAATKLHEALLSLLKRNMDREARDVEGYQKV